MDVLAAAWEDDVVAWYENDCATAVPTMSPRPTSTPTSTPTSAPTSAPTHVLCEPGTYSPDRSGAKCESCVAGKFSNGTGAYSCAVCPVNTFSEGGAAVCTDCESGRKSGLGSDSCGYCLEGQYQTLDADGAKVCVDCDAGWYSSLGLTCLPCGPGLHTTDGVACVSCESGRYSNGTANDGCADCPAGASAASGASRCAACAAATCDAGTCGQGTYSYAAASASCLACPYPLVATTSAAAYCDGCVAGTYWSDDAHSAFLESKSHEDGAQCATCCRACPDGSACDELGHTAETIVVEAGYWRGSVASVEVEACVRRGNCPGGAALGGDDLCDDHSEGIRCNECEAGFYLGPGGACAACGSSRLKLAALGVGLAAAAAVAYVARPYAARVPWKKKDWWLTTLLTLWYTAQSNVVFFQGRRGRGRGRRRGSHAVGHPWLAAVVRARRGARASHQRGLNWRKRERIARDGGPSSVSTVSSCRFGWGPVSSSLESRRLSRLLCSHVVPFACQYPAPTRAEVLVYIHLGGARI